MEDQVNKLVEKTWKKYQSLPPNRRLLIAISGIPGSGKTTLASLITKRLNGKYLANDSNNNKSSSEIAILVPMDGFHLCRAALDALPDPVTAHARRGAAFTFDGSAFAELARQLREPVLLPPVALQGGDGDGGGGGGGGSSIFAPSFDHAIKDPVAADIRIGPEQRVVVLEGLYLSLDKEPWRTAARIMDELWFVEVDFEVARKRLVRRHVEAGIAEDEAAAGKRADENDLVNGREIVEFRLPVDEVVVSNEDGDWTPGGGVLREGSCRKT